MELKPLLAGAVGAMAFGAFMVFALRRRDFVALWLGLFLSCVAASLLAQGGTGRWAGVLGLGFLAAFVAELQPRPWRRRAAAAVAALALLAGVGGWQAALQGLALAVAGYAVLASARLARERRSVWPALIPIMALGHPFLVLGIVENLEAAGFIAFVLAPGVVLTRRAIRALDAEERRALDQAKFARDAFDSVPVALSMRDPQGRYVFVNKTWEKYYGVRREQAIGTTPHSRASRADAERLLAMDQAALAAGAGVALPPQDFELGGRSYIQTRTAMADSQGRLLGVLVASIDTTERNAMREALQAEQRRFELVVRASNAGILDWNGTERTVYYSPRFKEILRHPPGADTSGWPDYFELIHPEDRERVQKRFRDHIFGAGEGGRTTVHETIQYRLRRADGTYVWIEAFGASVRDDKGYATRFIASITDISERRFQEEALRSAVRLREEVERMSRHDLKTPLNSVIAMSRLLRETGKLGADDEELLASIERAGYRILNMVNLSLDLFRMEQGSYEFRPRPVDLAAVARRVAADLEAQAASKNVAVRVAEGAWVAQAEDLLCYSLLANLVKNAIEASPDGGAVTVGFEAKAGALLARVHNLGAVPEEVRPRFFQKYATARKSGGIGLGAYSARLLARVQQGDITLLTSEEEGTTLTIQLALAAQAPSVSDATIRSSPMERIASSPGSVPRRVLVVDDDEFNRLVLRRCLPSPPFEVELAVNGRAAVEAAQRRWPDAVFLDLEMPVMDGYQAAKRLRRMERDEGRPRCTIAAISSNDEARIVQRALDAGCDHYLVKPASRDALLRVLAGEAPAPAAPLPDAAALDPVDLDADLEAALPAFLASRRKALLEMPEALAAGDRERLRRLAHKLAGAFQLYGFRYAAARCRAIEAGAAVDDAAELSRRAAEVAAHLDAVEIRVRQA